MHFSWSPCHFILLMWRLVALTVTEQMVPGGKRVTLSIMYWVARMVGTTSRFTRSPPVSQRVYNWSVSHHQPNEISASLKSLPAMFLGGRFCMSRKKWGGGAPKGWNSMVVSVLGCEMQVSHCFKPKKWFSQFQGQIFSFARAFPCVVWNTQTKPFM